MGERIPLEELDAVIDQFVMRAKDAEVGDKVFVYTPGGRYSSPYVSAATVTKVGRKWTYIDYDTWGNDRYWLTDRGTYDGQCMTDGGDFSQRSQIVYGQLDWDERVLRAWVDKVISESGLRFELGASPSWQKRLALATFLSESDLFETPDPGTITA